MSFLLDSPIHFWGTIRHSAEDWTECAHTDTLTEKSENSILRFHSVHLVDIIKLPNVTFSLTSGYDKIETQNAE